MSVINMTVLEERLMKSKVYSFFSLVVWFIICTLTLSAY